MDNTESLERLVKATESVATNLAELVKVISGMTNLPVNDHSAQPAKKMTPPCKYVTEKSPLSSAEFPRMQIRPARPEEITESASSVYGTVMEAALGLYQNGVDLDDIDVFFEDGKHALGSAVV